MGESKFDVLMQVPAEVRPRTARVRVPVTFTEVLATINEHGFQFPFIAKPDVGERGWMVKRINAEHELRSYWENASAVPVDFILQELIDLPLEFGVYYQRYPSQAHGQVTSITGKAFLSVVGDGTRTLQQLIAENPRAVLQWQTLATRFRHQLLDVLPAGHRLELESIGNHCLGTTFLNANHLITGRLNQSFDRISKQIPGFFFGRYDLRCATWADLENGRVQILELNGCGAEPAHIYHPGASLRAAIKTLIRHWRTLYEISVENHHRGVPYLSLREARRYYRRARALK